MNYKRIIGLLGIGVVILAIMIFYIGPEEILEAFQQADMSYVLIALILQFIVMSLWVTKWGILCDTLDIAHKNISLFAMMLVGLAINNLTPSGRSGGEPVRAYILSKSSDSEFRTTFASVMADKMFDLLPFTVLAFVAMGYLMFTINLSMTMLVTLFVAIIIFIILIVFVLYICFNETIGIKTIKWTIRQLKRFMTRDLDKYEEKAIEVLIGFQENITFLLKNKSVFIKAMIIAFADWILEILRVYVIFLAFGVHVSVPMVAAVFLLSTLAGMIPLLPGGVGIVDGIMIIIYSMAGVTTFISTAVTLIERLISYWLVSGLGVIALLHFGTEVIDEATESAK
ncbi:MAG: UPF0104 family protein [Methanosphaera sp.]|nr:UPF0104 family protein [Methanosphaera sp.]